MQNNKLNPAEILRKCSYTDFVGAIAQTNVPPGSISTVSEWAVFGRVNSASHVVEAACTTGFSLRELGRLTGCSGEGVDISAKSVETANHTIRDTALAGKVSYHVQDATTFAPSRRPTHVIVGAALGFFPNPPAMIERCATLFGNEGLLLASPFFTVGRIPEPLIDEARQVLGIRPTVAGYKEVMALYRGFQIVYESRKTIELETAEELAHYCASTTERALKLLGTDKAEVAEVIYKRLYEIRDLCNRLRPYQGYSVLVLRYDRGEYPNRYVELF